ncbi:hypothetical protein [Kribbella swartbergensis]
MNPTDEVDDLLTRAGARWRADQPSAPEPDLERMLGGRRRPRAWVPALAAASVAAIAAAALTVLPGGQNEPVPTADSSHSVAQGNQAPNDYLLVRNGDRVRVAGQVIAVPGKEPVFCPPLPKLAIGYPPGKEPAPSCEAQYAVRLKGLDLSRLDDARTIKGVRTGYAVLTGTWTDRTIEVQEQAVPQTRTTTLEQTIVPDEVPCPAPAGGWRSGVADIDQPAADFLAARASQAGNPRLLYPKGRVPGEPVVLTIGVAHVDPAAFKSAFAKVYDGNLCVHPVRLSKADLERIVTTVSSKMPKNLGVYGYGVGSVVDKVNISALVYDDALKAALTPSGLENFELEAAVKPVR